MTDTKFNGWTNYATWRVNLEMFDGATWDVEDGMDAHDLGLNLRDSAMSLITEQASGLALDYAEAFLADVNWYEIAEAMIANAKEEA